MAEDYSVILLSKLPKVIAARMTEAKQSIPHYCVLTDVDADPFMTARKELRRDLAAKAGLISSAGRS